MGIYLLSASVRGNLFLGAFVRGNLFTQAPLVRGNLFTRRIQFAQRFKFVVNLFTQHLRFAGIYLLGVQFAGIYLPDFFSIITNILSPPQAPIFSGR